MSKEAEQRQLVHYNLADRRVNVSLSAPFIITLTGLHLHATHK